MSPEFTREWLETNGIGGFASGTVAGAVSRRYHAFLCAATRAPQERTILVSKIEETLSLGDQNFDLSANFWPGEISPRGDRYLNSFTLDPLPRWVYDVPFESGTVQLEKTLWMPYESNTTVVRYRILDAPQGDISNYHLSIRAFVTGRDYHSTHHANPSFNTTAQVSPGQMTMQPYSNLPVLRFLHDGTFAAAGNWYCNFEWPIEAERGLDFHEDAWCPGSFNFELKTGSATFAATCVAGTLEALIATEKDEVARRTQIAGDTNWDEPANRLKRGADQVIVKREDGLHTVLAGYHWFTDWGRDTMIALPGLCLTTGRTDIAASILRSFAGTMSQGMIPNRFPEAGEVPEYNTVDATLWFVYAVVRYGEISNDWETVKELYPKLCEFLDWHLSGTRYGIVADDADGMLRAGDQHTQLTWMDAKVGDVAFTPRSGKAVEIQALWHSALCDMITLARQFDDASTAGICLEWSRKVAASFPAAFWNEAENCLYDCIDGTYRDGAIRPNQIFAVSLPHRLLSHEQEMAVVEVVQRELLTPHGLRSLSPRDSRYRGVYCGGQWSRDSSYHQGTVWAWPIGGFLSSYLKVNGGSDDVKKDAKKQVRAWLQPLLEHLDEAGLGTISEIFDGDAPHAPRGCIAQAWSVSEVLRLWEETK